MATITMICSKCGTKVLRTIVLPDAMETVAEKIGDFSCENCGAGPDKLQIQSIVE